MTQARVLRFFILGLPVGLIISGVIAMFLYFREQREPSLPMMSKAISRADIQSHVEMLAKTVGPRHAGDPDRLKAAVNYLESTLGPANLGYKVARHSYKAGDTEFHNLVLEIPGTDSGHSSEIVLVGAHYDTVPQTPGADDNASGVAACISLAQAFANTQHQRTLRFVFFANEEPPWFQTNNMGSLVYAGECKAGGEQIVAMLSLESIGYYSTTKGSQKIPAGLNIPLPDTGDFLAAAGNQTSAPLVERFKNWFAKNSTLPAMGAAVPGGVSEFGWSDHWSFWQQGYPAIMITDTALFRNPNYHAPSDTTETLDYERLTLAVKGLHGFIGELANPGKASKP